MKDRLPRIAARAAAAALAFAASVSAAEPAPAQPAPPPIRPVDNIFQMQQAFPLHVRLLDVFKVALQKNDYKTMLSVCSNAAAIFPKDPVWRYNFACSSARCGLIQQAKDQLLAAANLGFADHAGTSADTDLAIIRRDPAFARALNIMRERERHPESAPNAILPIAPQSTAPVNTTNTFWNMQHGGFSSLFTQRTPSIYYTPLKTGITGKTGELVNKWLKEGTASGNAGDIYDNHDRGHSKIPVDVFTGMVPTSYSREARDAGADTGVSLFSFPGRIAIGNSSTAFTAPGQWMSCARLAQIESPGILMGQYLSNCAYVYPQHRDYLADNLGDTFPNRTPYVFISHGASWTDRPILAAMATALAALRPEVKDELASAGRIAPALQYLLRMAQTNVVERTDYLTPAAHPVVFDGGAIDTLRIAELAHSIETNALPPMASLLVLSDDSANYKPGEDFAGAKGERIFDTPFAICRVWRAYPRSRKMILTAGNYDLRPLRFHWFVGQGDTNCVKITTFDDGRRAMLEIDWHEPGFDTPFGVKSSRLDIICVADDGVHFSPPAFVTWFFPPNEKRSWDIAGRLTEIDYSSRKGVYADPHVAPPQDFIDRFTYDASGARTGRRVYPDGREEPLPLAK